MTTHTKPHDAANELFRQTDERQARVLGDGPRLAPIELKEISSGLLNILRRMENVNGTLKTGERDRSGTENLRALVLADPEAAAKSSEILAQLTQLPEIVRTMLRHAELFAAHTDVGLQLLVKGALSLRDRELAVLRIAWLCQAPYEWGEHVLVAKRFGFTSADIEQVIAGPATEGLSVHERAILQAVDELYNDAMISDATWNALAQQLNERQLIELPIVIGQYQSVAYYQNSLRLRLHDGNLGLKAR